MLRVQQSKASAAVMLTASAAVGAAVGVFGSQAAVIVAGAAVVAGLLRSPGVALALYLLVPPFLKGLLQPLVFVDLTLALGLVCALHVAHGIVARPVSIKGSAAALWLALLAMVSIGMFYAPDQGIAIGRVQQWVGLVFLPLLAVFWVVRDQREVERFVWTCLAVGLSVTVLALFAFSPSERLVIGITTTINVGRASLMVPIIVFFFVMKEGPKWARGPLLVITPLTLVLTFAAGSRGPLLMFLALAAGLSIWHVARGRRIAKGKMAGTVAAILLLGVIVAVSPLPSVASDGFDRLAGYLSSDGPVDGSVELRLAAADLSFSIFEDHPLLGAGTGAFTYYAQFVPQISNLEYPHNVILEIASDWGVIGLALLAVLILAAIRRRPPEPVWTAVWGLFLFYFANSLLGSFFDGRAFWGFMLLLLAAPVAAHAGTPAPEPDGEAALLFSTSRTAAEDRVGSAFGS